MLTSEGGNGDGLERCEQAKKDLPIWTFVGEKGSRNLTGRARH